MKVSLESNYNDNLPTSRKAVARMIAPTPANTLTAGSALWIESTMEDICEV